jgi:hypothetical protein
MQAVTWVLFWPETRDRSILFHLFRQGCIFFFIFFALCVHRSLFSVFLMLFSLIEYSRRAQFQALFGLYFTIVAASVFSSYSSAPYVPSDVPARSILWFFIRGLVFFVAIVFDHLTAKRFGITSIVATIAFPILVAGAFAVLIVLDPLGIAIHLSSLCPDYPDFTFLFRLFGPTGTTFLLAFFSAHALRWRITRLVNRVMVTLILEILTVLVVGIALYRWFCPASFTFMNAIVVCKSADFLRSKPGKADLIVVNQPIPEPYNGPQPQRFVDLAKTTGAVVVFAYGNHSETWLSVISPDDDFVWRRKTSPASTTFPRIFLKDITSVKWQGRTIGVCYGREMLGPEFFTSKDMDLLVTFGGSDWDEGAGLPMRAARMTTQMTGASRLHVSAFGQSFAMTGDGGLQFVDDRRDVELVSREYRVKVVSNWWKWNGGRFLIAEWVMIGSFVGLCLLNVVSKKAAMNFVYVMERMFGKMLPAALL